MGRTWWTGLWLAGCLGLPACDGPEEKNTDGETVTDSVSPPATTCPVTFRYDRTGADRVYVAGDFNDWDRTAVPLERDGTGWTVTTELPPGAWSYKFVEVQTEGAGSVAWACDPTAEQVVCDEGYSWDPSCPTGGGGCNSLVVVPDCNLPDLETSALTIDRAADSVDVTVAVTGTLIEPWATLDGAVIDAWEGTAFRYVGTGLSDGRHTLRFGGKAADGTEVEEEYVPFWLDDRSWDDGLLYFVFVDRFANGDASLDTPEGASTPSGEYLGGDWQGVIDRLDDLDQLGVTELWLTAPQDNADGDWAGICGETFSGYHGYWVTHPTELEGHFGDEATLADLVAAAHARNIRVITDLVANQVHEDHVYREEHPDWFTDQFICEEDEDGNGVVNWDQRPETCWFTSYLPDVSYYQKDALTTMTDDAIAFAKRWELDGYRVDAVKHMPKSAHFDLAARVASEIEHREAGGDEDFYTVGETFSGDRDLILSYVGETAGGGQMLDGQFDFALYWGIVAAFAREEIGLSNGDGSLQSIAAASQEAFAGHLMSTFLGNHDVARFIAHASGEIGSLYGDALCADDGGMPTPDAPPSDSTPYQKLALAWTFLLTSPGLPLVYYGDEIGLPGHMDPDNRQMMRFDEELSADEASVRAVVAALGQARREHPVLARGTSVGWWENDADFWAYTRSYEGEHALVLLNRGSGERTVTNGLAYAGLPEGTWRDLVTGETFTSAGDSLTVTVPGRMGRVLLAE